jgi:hypothetical protein
MKKIGGNTTAILQVKLSGGRNQIGENIDVWSDAIRLKGWLDYSTGQNSVNQYDAKLQDTSHIFLCDFDSLVAVTDDFVWGTFNFEKDIIVTADGDESTIKVTSENCRMMIGGDIYHVLQIDDPMGLHEHLEIYLQYIGGGLGV